MGGLVWEPSAGYTFDWVGLEGAGATGTAVETIRAPLIKSDRHEVTSAWDQRVIQTSLGYFFPEVATLASSVVSP